MGDSIEDVFVRRKFKRTVQCHGVYTEELGLDKVSAGRKSSQENMYSNQKLATSARLHHSRIDTTFRAKV